MIESHDNYDIKYEMLNGKIVYMSPRPSTDHNKAIRNLTVIFGSYLKKNKYQLFPDGVHGAPDLVVEILSPSTALNDKSYKKDLYEKFGVKEY